MKWMEEGDYKRKMSGLMVWNGRVIMKKKMMSLQEKK